MSSTEYIDQVNRLINLQNNYLTIFLGVLAVVIGFFGVIQWKLSDKQIERIKNEVELKITEKYKKEIEDSFQQSHKIIIESQRVAVFTSIELITITDIRLKGIPNKVANLLSTLPTLENIYSEEASILLETLKYLLKYKDKVLIEDEKLGNLLGIEGLVMFIEQRAPILFLEENKSILYRYKIEIMQLIAEHNSINEE
ncbi:hypothetical protein ACO1PF_00440 [Alkalibacterium sp. f15]|uniref:hypothetical protein n=1 Tax=Alkalibacterium sp. f15 TaxID=3414029 RepID=UPI003BF7C2BA